VQATFRLPRVIFCKRHDGQGIFFSKGANHEDMWCSGRIISSQGFSDSHWSSGPGGFSHLFRSFLLVLFMTFMLCVPYNDLLLNVSSSIRTRAYQVISRGRFIQSRPIETSTVFSHQLLLDFCKSLPKNALQKRNTILSKPLFCLLTYPSR